MGLGLVFGWFLKRVSPKVFNLEFVYMQAMFCSLEGQKLLFKEHSNSEFWSWSPKNTKYHAAHCKTTRVGMAFLSLLVPVISSYTS